ncbi:LemA family protein [Pleurocapsa sp. PCC 7319]|uniref:LemA family protein n=1 Tax=Pleurocapsa sp. PCC 7319 TaxID=118161 RepID=UPI00034AADBF|nr:LemA family protein [Pleurocapsa sp. PCC 7319]
MNSFVSILLSVVIVFLLLTFTIFIIGVRIYNGLIYKKNQVSKSFSSVDVLLKKRWDLIPNLVSVVKHHMEFEQQTLAEITRLRSRVMSNEVSEGERLNLENQISRTMGNILALIENYPELKSDQHVNQLLASLNEIEEQISAARRFYNAAVTEYNNAIEMFPSNLVANYMQYRPKELFVTTEEERSNVNVGDLLNG